MPQITTLRGPLVGAERSSYGAFTGGDGREVPAGETLSVYLGVSLDQGPEQVRVDAEQFAQLVAGGFGAQVVLSASPTVKRGRIVYRCQSIASVDRVTEPLSGDPGE